MMKSIYLTFFLCCLSAASQAFEQTITVTEKELQEKIDALMPVIRQESLFKITVKDPLVDLLKENNKINLKTTVDVLLLGAFNHSAKLSMAGNVLYKAEEGAFFIHNIEVNDIQSASIDPAHIEPLKRSTANTLNELMKQHPIYTLDERKSSEKIARAMLKDVVVKDEKLLITLSPMAN